MEEKTLQIPAAPHVADPSKAGESLNGKEAGASAKAKKGSRLPWKVVLPILFVLAAGATAVGYNYWIGQSYYVSTDNAQVAGALVQVGAMNAGRVDALNVDVGYPVQRDQVIGTVLLPSTLNVSQSGTPRLGFIGSENQRVEIRASVSGVVVARLASIGDTIAAGQPVVTVVDPTKLWVQAQIEETKIGRVQVGQPVEVRVDSLGKTLSGRVVAVSRASSGTFSLLPSSNSSGNFTKVTQLVPVKVAIDYGDQPLVLGSSVEVRIRVRD